MADYFQLLSGIVAVFLALYYYLTSTFDFWKNLGVPGPQPIPLFGNVKNVMLKRINIGNYIQNLYNEYKNEPLVGFFVRGTPALILRDLDLIKDVLIKDFSMFDDRGNDTASWAEPLSQNLFNLEPLRWRPLRTRLSPVFTSGRMKEMFPLILECSENLKHCLDKEIAKGGSIEVREIAARYSTDVIGSCAFGINMNALSDEESEFRRIGRKIFEQDLKTILRITFRDCAPRLYNIVGFMYRYSEINLFLTKVVGDTVKYRIENNIHRPDFINMLIELKKHPDKLDNIELTDSLLAAQAFIFFAAGFETSSTTIGHALYEMALNPDMQDKLRVEIKEFNGRNNGNWKYETIKEMKYLDKVFKETLRKYPAGMILRRKCTNSYTFNGTKVSVPVGTPIFIPVFAIHRDPNYYPNPDVFDPERFTEEAVAARHPQSFLTFGDGPRNCVGARFAVYQIKIALIKILRDFKMEVCENTMIPYENKTNCLILSPKRGIHLKVTKVVD